MALNNVVFEIQVDKKLLQNILNENEFIKDKCGKMIKLESEVRDLKEHLIALNQSLDHQMNSNIKLGEENLNLKTQVDELQIYKRVLDEKKSIQDTSVSENKLLKIKIQTIEEEKRQILCELERESRIFERVLTDNNKLHQEEAVIKELSEEIAVLKRELEISQVALTKSQQENLQLDEEKLLLERAFADLSLKFRVLQEKNNSQELEEVESKLLKLKLQTVEKEKVKIMQDFQKEISIINRKQKPKILVLEENLKLLKDWIDRSGAIRSGKPVNDVKALKEKVDDLEKEKQTLQEAFDMERAIFRRILKDNDIKHDLH